MPWVPVWLVDQCDWSGSHPTVKLKAQVPSGAIQLWSWDHRFHLELSKALTHVRCGWSIGVRDRDSLDGSLKNWESAVLWGEVTFTEDVSLCWVWQARVHKFHLHKGGTLCYHDILAQVSLDPKVAFVFPTLPPWISGLRWSSLVFNMGGA